MSDEEKKHSASSRENESRLVDARTVATRLSITVARVYELTRIGFLPFSIKLGRGQYRYNPEQMERWISSGGKADTFGSGGSK